LAPSLASTPLNDPITKHLRQDFARIAIDQTVGGTLESLRAKPPEGRIIYLYVVDAENRLQGVIPTRRLLLSAPETPVAEIMVKNVVTINQSASVLDACEFFTLHRFLAFPVVDDERHLVGVVDVELYTDELSEMNDPDLVERADDLFQLIGVHLAGAKQSSPLRSFRQRFPWLLCNIGGGILSALIMGVFEEELQKAVTLALFVPVVLALAESVSIQSVTLGLLRLKNQKPTWSELFGKLSREICTGLLLGLGCAVMIGGTAAIWKGDWHVAFCLLAGISGGVMMAAAFGLAMPYVLRLMKRDPEVAAGPIALAIADMVSLLIYLNLARAVL